MKLNQKPCIATKKVIDRGKRSKTLSEVKLVENISNFNHKSILAHIIALKKYRNLLELIGSNTILNNKLVRKNIIGKKQLCCQQIIKMSSFTAYQRVSRFHNSKIYKKHKSYELVYFSQCQI